MVAGSWEAFWGQHWFRGPIHGRRKGNICHLFEDHSTFLTCWKVDETLYITGGWVQLDRAPSWHLEAEKSQRVQEQGAGGQLKYHMVQADWADWAISLLSLPVLCGLGFVRFPRHIVVRWGANKTTFACYNPGTVSEPRYMVSFFSLVIDGSTPLSIL